jgi:ribosomal protein S18 acetylase RimI-like enzyme
MRPGSMWTRSTPVYRGMPASFSIRPASVDDLRALHALENRVFATDRISQRQFRYLLTKGHAITLIAEQNALLLGYVLVLLRRSTSLGRLYSIAVAPEGQGRGVGSALLDAAEQQAIAAGVLYMRSEVRVDNQASISLFERAGYRPFGAYRDYYEDHADALRFEKRLVRRDASQALQVPYYAQTLDFTCGPAALMMAMKALDEHARLTRSEEIRLWREATTVFMTSGHGGCGPYGLALAAHRRGFAVRVQVSARTGMFVDGVRDPQKKEVIRLVELDFLQELRRQRIRVETGRLTAAVIDHALARKEIPVVLISSARLYGERFPHWVVVSGNEEQLYFIHDPYVDAQRGRGNLDSIDIPITKGEFERMLRYGRAGHQAALFIGPRQQEHTE